MTEVEFKEALSEVIKTPSDIGYCASSDGKRENAKKFADANKGSKWPEQLQSVDALFQKMVECKGTSPVVLGKAEDHYQAVMTAGRNLGFDMSFGERVKKDERKASDISLGTVTRAEVLGNKLKEDGGKIVPMMDVVKFQTEVTQVVSRVNRKEILTDIASRSSEQDFWNTLVEMITRVEESAQLIGLLSARLLVSIEAKKSIDNLLMGVTILLNRQGKLSEGLIRLGGFIGLACVKDDVRVASTIKRVRNPLLNQDVDEFKCIKRANETVEDYHKREEISRTKYNAYKQMMNDLKIHAPHFAALDSALKGKIGKEVMKFVYGDA